MPSSLHRGKALPLDMRRPGEGQGRVRASFSRLAGLISVKRARVGDGRLRLELLRSAAVGDGPLEDGDHFAAAVEVVVGEVLKELREREGGLCFLGVKRIA